MLSVCVCVIVLHEYTELSKGCLLLDFSRSSADACFSYRLKIYLISVLESRTVWTYAFPT